MSSQIWKILGSSFPLHSKAKIMKYKAKLHSIKKGGLSFSDYIQKIRNFLPQLGAAGSCISEENQILVIYYGLNERYDAVVANINEIGVSFT